MLKIKKIRAKSILNKSKLPKSDYAINPYSGCSFGCSYCYADFTKRFTGHSNDNWGKYVDVKINAPELLDKELSLLIKRIENKREKEGVVILLSSVTDPYQGIEAKYKITRKCLRIASKLNETNSKLVNWSILTKSPLVTRDIDLD